MISENKIKRIIYLFKALRNGINEILFCVGDYPDIIALHPHDLNILYTLNSRAEPDWITSITLVQPTEKHG